MKKINIIIPACDFYQGQVGTETFIRMNVGTDFILKNDDNYYHVFFGAGEFQENGKTYIAKQIMSQTFVEMLFEKWKIRYPKIKRSGLLTLKREKFEIFTPYRNVWGSFKEMEICVESIKRFGFQGHKTIIFSSKYHIRRLKFIFKFLDLQDVEFISIDIPQYPIDKLLTPLKYLKAFCLGMKRKNNF